MALTQSRQRTTTGDLADRGLGVLAEEIARARYLLELPDDWDTDGSPAFHVDTWSRTVGLAEELCGRLADGWSMTPRDVEIMPGANGNLSLEVAYPAATLLFSVPPERGAPIRYYGHSAAAERTKKGLLAPEESLDWLSLWIDTS